MAMADESGADSAYLPAAATLGDADLNTTTSVYAPCASWRDGRYLKPKF